MNYFPGNKKGRYKSTILSYPLLVSGSVRLCLQNRTVPFFFYSSFDSFKSGTRSLRGFFSQETGFCSERYELLSWNKRTVHKVPSSHILYLFQVRSGFAYRTEQFHFFFYSSFDGFKSRSQKLTRFFHRKLDSVRAIWITFPETKRTVHKVPSSHILYLFQVRSGFAYRTERFHFSFYSSFDSFKSRSQKLTRIFSQETGFCSERYELLSWNKKDGTQSTILSYPLLVSGSVRLCLQNRTVPFFSFTVALIASNPEPEAYADFSQETGFCSGDMNYFPWNKKDGTQSTILSYPLLVSGSVGLLPTEPNSSIFLLQ